MEGIETVWGWVLIPNPYTGLWAAVKREDINEFYSNGSSWENPKFLKSKDVNLLIEGINNPEKFQEEKVKQQKDN